MPRSRLLCCCLSAVIAAACAATELPGVGHAADPPGKETAAELEADIERLLKEKQYDAVAEKCARLATFDPRSPFPPYLQACALARLGKTSEALAALDRSVDLGMFDAELLQSDEDLESLRGEEAFAALVAKCETTAANWFAVTHDTGGDAQDLRSVEGAPEGGLPWRLLLGKDADSTKPRRLLVWLHPSGGSMNSAICGLAKRWTRAGFAVLLPTEKQWACWKVGELDQLLAKTIPDAAKTPGVDAMRPVLAGFSAGGQAALMMWQKDPARFGGLFLDAAYPFTMFQDGTVETIAIPEGEAAKYTPILVFVGDADPHHTLWKESEEAWRAAGVPLVVDYVENGAHEWLVVGARAKRLDQWLKDIAAGGLPGTAEATPAPQ